MRRYSFWNKPGSWEEAAFHEKAYSFKDMARWEARWQALTPRARLAYLKDVKGLNRAQGQHRDRPSVQADLLDPQVLEELLTAGFVELGNSGTGRPRDLVFAVVAATDFMARVRTLHRHHLLRGDLPSMLETHVRHAFYQTVEVALRGVIREAGLDEYLNLDGMVNSYVVGHRWPGWVALSLKNPNAERIIELLRNANGPIRRAQLVEQLPDIDAVALQAALGSLLAHLAVFEDLNPETFELLIGFLPSVRVSMAAALLPRTRPPLIVSENFRTIGPEGSIIVDDLRAFLLEIVAEPPRLRQDGQIFQKDLDRFLDALGELPSALLHALELTQAKRLNQAGDWARGVELVEKRARSQAIRLELSSQGSLWLSSNLKEQYSQVYKFLAPLPTRSAFGASATYIPSIDTVYGERDSDHRFLGTNVSAVPSKRRQAPRYWELKPEDHAALRDSIHRSLAALPLGVFHTVENVLDHLVFGQFNPLLLGLDQESVTVFSHSRPVPPLVERTELVARSLLTDFIRQRLIPLGCVQAAIDADGNLCIARQRRLDVYFGHEDDETETAGQAATQTRVVVQPDFSIIIIGLNPAPAAELIAFCEREKHRGHGALTLRLTRESVVKAVAHGIKPAEIVDRLRRLATNELPANVLRQVSDWCGWVRRAHASAVTIVRCPDSETADRVVAAMKRQAERVTETIVAINQLKLTTADRNKLRDQGILIDGKDT